MNSLIIPHQLAYPSLEEARAAIDAHAHLEGYVVVVKRTRRIGNKKYGDITAVIIVCLQSNPLSYPQVPDIASVCRPAVALAVYSPPVYDMDKLEIGGYKLPKKNTTTSFSPTRLPIRTSSL